MKVENILSPESKPKIESQKRLNQVLLYGGLLVATLGITFAIGIFGAKAGFLIMVLLIGVPAIILTLSDIRFGTLILLSFSFFLSRIGHFVSSGIPFGIVLDALIFLMLTAVVIRKSRRGDFKLATTPLSYLVWIWLVYNAFEFFNPMQSKEAWIYVIRSTAGHMMFYFIVKEALTELGYFKKFMTVWLFLAFLGACYGLFQEFHGLTMAEKAWVMGNEERFKLFYNWGDFRTFSFFNDPTVYGILMSFTGLFCLTLAMGPLKIWLRGVLLFMGGIMLLSVVYTGTRTAYVMLPAGFGFFACITLQMRTITASGIFFVIAAFIIFSDIKSVGPFISTNSLERVRSAFKPKDDPSYQLRLQNQARIKPFMHSHPFGAGLGSIGSQGERFEPDSRLAGFDADSTYVKFGVELGWVGLFLYCILLVMILIKGIRSYYRVNDPEIKAYIASLTSVIFSIVVANYPQMATIQLPNAFIFYAMVAFIDKLGDLDKKTKTHNPI